MKTPQKKALSAKAQQLWDSLDKQTRLQLDKHYPVKRERNDAIATLRDRGVSLDVLAEITGLNKSTLLYVARGQKDSILPLGELARNVKLLKDDLDLFYNSILAIVNEQIKRARNAGRYR
jgi:hypothetical protein